MTTQRGQIGIEHLPATILKGIKKAKADYHTMTGVIAQEWPEYWVTVYVARYLWKQYGDNVVTMESNSDTVITRRSGKPTKITKNKSYDIVLWRKDGYARAVIEIKHQQADKKKIISDLNRVVSALDAGKYLQVGAVGYFYNPPEHTQKEHARKWSREQTVKYRDDIIDLAKHHVRGTGYRIRAHDYLPHGLEDSWIAGCLIVEDAPGTKNKRGNK